MNKETNPLNNVGQAYQYSIRQQKQIEEKDNQYWKNIDLSIKNSVVKPVSLSFAKKIIEEYEYLGCIAAVNFHQYGIFFENVCGGVVIFGQEYAENQGVWDKFGFTGKIILLNRGVCLHWTPKNTNSHLIMEAIKQLPSKYEIVTATIDPEAGEIGTIYQACNWYYVGALRKNKVRTNIIINGKKYGSRSVRQRFGTMSKDLLPDIVKKSLGENSTIEFINVHAKHRYFYFRGNKNIKTKHYNSIKDLIKSYPKRKI